MDAAPSTKICQRCKVEKDCTQFSRDKNRKGGLSNWCKDCYNQQSKEKKYFLNYQARRRNYALLRYYGISEMEYAVLFARQRGVCAICGEAETHIDKRSGQVVRLAVDHDHVTGAVRGLLCNKCNIAISYLDEDADRFLRVLQYLKLSSTNTENQEQASV